MVRKIYIYTSEEAKRLSPKRKLPPVIGEVVKSGSKKALFDADADTNAAAGQKGLGGQDDVSG